MKRPLSKGQQITMDKSTFVGYKAKVQTIDDINLFYKRVKLIQPKARHIVCAYRINNADLWDSQNYHDDGEPGAGRQILQVLKENVIENTAVFIARRYGGIRMGTSRFTCYINAAKHVLNIPIESTISPSTGRPRAHTGPSVPEHRSVPEHQQQQQQSQQQTRDERSLHRSTNSVPAPPRYPPRQQYYQRGRAYNRSGFNKRGVSARGRGSSYNNRGPSAVRGARPYSTQRSQRQNNLNELRGAYSRPAGSRRDFEPMEYSFSDPHYPMNDQQEDWPQGENQAW